MGEPVKFGIGDRVVPRADAPYPNDDPPPPPGAIGVVIGFVVRFPGIDNTWMFDHGELDPAAIEALGDLVRDDDVQVPSLNEVYGTGTG